MAQGARPWNDEDIAATQKIQDEDEATQRLPSSLSRSVSPITPRIPDQDVDLLPPRTKRSGRVVGRFTPATRARKATKGSPIYELTVGSRRDFRSLATRRQGRSHDLRGRRLLGKLRGHHTGVVLGSRTARDGDPHSAQRGTGEHAAQRRYRRNMSSSGSPRSELRGSLTPGSRSLMERSNLQEYSACGG